MTVAAILSRKGRTVITIEPGADLGSAVILLAERGIGAVVVTSADSRIAGILSERDIVRALARHGGEALRQPVSQVMTRKVTTCRPDETFESIMERMTEGKFRHVPVLENERLSGIISIGDVVKHRIEEIEHESASLRDYIHSA